MEPGAQLDEGRDSPFGKHFTGRGFADPGQDLEQSTFPGTIFTNDAQGFTLF